MEASPAEMLEQAQRRAQEATPSHRASDSGNEASERPKTVPVPAASGRLESAAAASAVPAAPQPAEATADRLAQDVARLARNDHSGSSEDEDEAEVDSDALKESSEGEGSDEPSPGWLLDKLALMRGLGSGAQMHQQVQEQILATFDMEGVADYIRSSRAQRIVCMVGAGISVSAGIPDFRSPGTGLYSQLEKYNLPDPQALFEISFFRQNPEPFTTLSKGLFPGNFRPTPAHHFMRLLHDKGLLLRCFTQNIDSLEAQAGLPAEAIVAAHGNFDSAHCIQCKKEYTTEYVRDHIMSDKVCRCTRCKGLVKPDIVFFGESLPKRFFQRRMADLPKADLLIVMGTSLVVHPFAGLLDDVNSDCPRLLVNRERVGMAEGRIPIWGGDRGLRCDLDDNRRDAAFIGNADDGVLKLCELLGWEKDLQALIDAK